MLLAKGRYRDCELESYHDGCIPNTGHSIEWSVDFEAETIEELLNKIKDYHDVTDDNIILEGSDLYIQTNEIKLYGRWLKPTEKDIQNWKKGKQEMYLVHYSYQLFQSL